MSHRKNWNYSRESADLKLEVEARQIYLNTLIESRTAELKMLDVEAISNPGQSRVA